MVNLPLIILPFMNYLHQKHLFGSKKGTFNDIYEIRKSEIIKSIWLSWFWFSYILIFYSVLHVFLGDNFNSLKSLLQSQGDATNFHPTKPTELIGLNVWVIHVIGEKRREELFNVLIKSPLRFDSHVFEFFCSDQG